MASKIWVVYYSYPTRHHLALPHKASPVPNLRNTIIQQNLYKEIILNKKKLTLIKKKKLH